MVEELVELSNLEVLRKGGVGLLMKLVPTDGENSPAPENVPEITNQGGAVYNAD